MRRAEPCTRSATLRGAARLTFAGDRRVVARSGSGDRLVPLLEAIHERLAGVWIDCLGFEAFIERRDRPKTLFCLDPLYWALSTVMAGDCSSNPTSNASAPLYSAFKAASSCR
jgi:site-specific DNA-adenine methylase